MDKSDQSLNNQSNGNHKLPQTKVMLRAFSSKPKTMLMVAVETGILRANICRYLRHYQSVGLIQFVKYGCCAISRHRAGFYSSNPKSLDPNNQLPLFND